MNALPTSSTAVIARKSNIGGNDLPVSSLDVSKDIYDTTSKVPKKRKRKPARPFRVHSVESLAPYRRFTSIYLELKWQRPKKPQRVPFLALPLEIRLNIYEYHLVLSKPLEMWAETGDAYLNQKIRRRDTYDIKKAFLYKRAINLSLLRVNKQVNIEAAEVYYGANEFRFSGPNGHMAAYAYACKIDSRNLDCIQSIKMAVPFESNDRGRYGENWNPSCWRRVHEIYDRMPFPFPRKTGYERWRYARLDFQGAWCKLAWMLTKAYRLKSINFVLPQDVSHGFYLTSSRHHTVLSAVDDLVAAKPFLEMHVIRMYDPEGDIFHSQDNHSHLIKMLKLLGVCRVHLAAFDLQGDWRLAPQPYVNNVGRFVVNKELDVSVDPIDVLPDVRQLLAGTAY